MDEFHGAYFTQMTDIHIGSSGWNREQARKNLEKALSEMAEVSHLPEIVLVTADLVNSGTREELAEYAAIASHTKLRLASLPANHDLWGEEDTSAWTDLIGPVRHHVDIEDRRYILVNAHHSCPDNSWKAALDSEQMAWLKGRIQEWAPKPVFVAMHPPILPRGDDWHDVWKGSNAPEVVSVLHAPNVKALITGHWHRNGEWNVRGVRQITTGALTGWQWNATPPYYHFPTRPGYRWFHFDGETLRTFWREVSPSLQATLTWAGPVHVGGPRPQVRPPLIGGPIILRAETWSQLDPVIELEWSMEKGHWHKMTKVWEGLWSEWHAPFDSRECRVGEAVLCVRAKSKSGKEAYDAVPARIDQGHPARDAVAGPEMVFELFYLPE